MTWPVVGMSLAGIRYIGVCNRTRLTVDPATVLRSEETDHSRDVVGKGTSAERAVVGHHVLDLLSWNVGGSVRDVVPSVLR